jgi:hypothetical protein
VSKGRFWRVASSDAVYARDDGDVGSDGGAGAVRGKRRETCSGGYNAPKEYVVIERAVARENVAKVLSFRFGGSFVANRVEEKRRLEDTWNRQVFGRLMMARSKYVVDMDISE